MKDCEGLNVKLSVAWFCLTWLSGALVFNAVFFGPVTAFLESFFCNPEYLICHCRNRKPKVPVKVVFQNPTQLKWEPGGRKVSCRVFGAMSPFLERERLCPVPHSYAELITELENENIIHTISSFEGNLAEIMEDKMRTGRKLLRSETNAIRNVKQEHAMICVMWYAKETLKPPWHRKSR